MIAMVRRVVVGMFSHMLGMACCKVVQPCMFRLLWQGLGDDAGQQRTYKHAKSAGDDTGELRWKERVFRTEDQDGKPNR
jgi:hypothetical protein